MTGGHNLLYPDRSGSHGICAMTGFFHRRREALCTAAIISIFNSVAPVHAEDVYWITGPGDDTEVDTRYGTAASPLRWFDTTKWFTDVADPQTPNNAIPSDGQSIAHSNSCCNPEPFVDIDNGGSGVNLPNSAIRFEAKTNLVDSSAGDVTDIGGGSYDFAAVDDTLVADTIAFNGTGGRGIDVYVPVVADTFTSNRHGAALHAPFTVKTILANSEHQDKWVINASPTAPLTLILLDENRGVDGDSIDGSFRVNVDLATATLDHVWSRLVVGSGATLSVGTYHLADYSANTPPNNNPAPLVLEGDLTVEVFHFGDIRQEDGTWGELGSGADHEVAWITGAGLLTVGSGVGEQLMITETVLDLDTDAITLTWISKAEKIYTIAYSPDLPWTPTDVINNKMSQGETTSHTFPNPAPSSPQVFFRVRENQ